MRELKFRTWLRFEKRFLFGDLHDFPHGMYDGEITQQFTGLTDKNGKEIYEGDILIGKRSKHYKYLVEFSDGSFVISLYQRHPRVLTSTLIRGDLEIIGNIFETPELLNVKD